MGKNTGNGTRIGLTKNRHQFKHPTNSQWMKVNSNTGKFLGSRSEPWKNIRIKKTAKCPSARNSTASATRSTTTRRRKKKIR